MELRQILRILWRRLWLIALALALGTYLAVQAMGQSYTTYETSMTLILDNPEFGLGRVQYAPEKGDSIARTISLAPVYAALIVSDRNVELVRKKVGSVPDQFSAEPVNDAPLIKVTLKSAERWVVVEAAAAMAEGFIEDMVAQQKAKQIPPEERVVVRLLSAPASPTEIQSRRMEIAGMYFLAPIVATVFLVFVLENISATLPDPERRQVGEAEHPEEVSVDNA